MRAPARHRSVASISSILSLVVFTAASMVAENANAQAAPEKTSSATAPLVFATSSRLYTAGAELADDHVNVKVGLSFGPQADSPDVVRVDMSNGAAVQATWQNGKTFTLTTVGAKSGEAVLRAAYQLAPTIDLTIDAGRILGTFKYGWNSNDLMNELLYGANFEYTAAAQSNYASWAWEGVSVTVPGAPIQNSKLMSKTFEAFSGELQGEILVAMTTTPKFTYRTKSVLLGSSSTLLQAGGQFVELPIVDGDFLEVGARVQGQIDYTGTMVVAPKVAISQVLGVPFPISFDVGSGKDFTYGSTESPGAPVPVAFAPAIFHIPLPNVKVRQPALDMGSSTVGQEVSRTITVENTGEMAAVIEVASSNPQFKATPTAQLAPKSKRDIEVRFAAINAGAQSAVLTLKSNDPDQPVMQINVSANGATNAATTTATSVAEEEGEEPNTGSPGGCGCITAGSRASNSSIGFAGALMAAAVMLARRVRRSGRA